jgi:hypothetical protein
MQNNLVKAPIEGEYLAKGEYCRDEVTVDMADLFRTVIVHSEESFCQWKKTESTPKPKPTFMSKVKANPWPYVLFCMQMFWPTVLVVWLIFRQFWR